MTDGENKDLTWGTIVPLIGGLTVAGRKVTGKDPDFLLSYGAFADNERNIKQYLPNVPHYLLDEHDRGGFDLPSFQPVDFVQALCPCAGLSLLSSGSQEHRATMNKWMIESAEFVTGEVQPRVFWGENAPALYSGGGTHVRDQLKQIAHKNGYAFSVYLTSTHLHGIPQSRKRSFYFFWKGPSAPVMSYFSEETPSYGDYMKNIKHVHHTKDEIDVARQRLYDDPYMQYLAEDAGSVKKVLKEMKAYILEKDQAGTTLLSYLIGSRKLKGAQGWFESKGFNKQAKEADRILKKDGGGYWDGSSPLYRADKVSAALIGRTVYQIHPNEDRTLTTGECMHLMGLPADFNLVTENLNHICQNVPVMTASDMTREVIKYIRGESETSGATVLHQNNISKKIEHREGSRLIVF